MNASKTTLAALAAVALVTVLTIAGELVPPLKAWMASTFYHHWIAKGVLAIAAFALVALFGPQVPLEKLERAASPLIIICTLAIFAFFTLHFLKVF